MLFKSRDWVTNIPLIFNNNIFSIWSKFIFFLLQKKYILKKYILKKYILEKLKNKMILSFS